MASVGLYEDCGAETHTCAICSTSTCTTAILVLFTVLQGLSERMIKVKLLALVLSFTNIAFSEVF